MRGVHRISKDALPWMKGVRPLRWQRFFRLAARTGVGLVPLVFHEGKIIDRPRPGELCVVEGGIMPGRSGDPRIRQDQKDDMPQRSGEQGTARNSPLDPAILKETAGQKILRNTGPAEKRRDAASNALMKASPGEIEFRLVPSSQARGSGRSGALPQEVQCPADLAHRHFPFFKSKPRTPGLAR